MFQELVNQQGHYIYVIPDKGGNGEMYYVIVSGSKSSMILSNLFKQVLYRCQGGQLYFFWMIAKQDKQYEPTNN